MATLSSLLERGYFPYELPPPFRTRSFAAALQGASEPSEFLLSPRYGKPAIHNVVRVGGLRRQLSVPNPIHYFRIAKLVIDEWPTISAHCASSRLSASTPMPRLAPKRALAPKHPHGELHSLRVPCRTNAKFLVRTDIAQCYDSIYTHSIPWSLHSKAIVKAEQLKPRDNRQQFMGDRLDIAVRSAQDRETLGIPIGPDTSFVIAEIVLSAADKLLSARFARLRGFRHVDDYEFCVGTVEEGHEVLHHLEDVLHDFGLRLNSEKTRLLPLPQPIERSWAIELRRFAFRDTTSGQRVDLEDYFSRAFELSHQYPDEFVLNYALGRLRGLKIEPSNWLMFHLLLMQAGRAEPGTLAFVLREMARGVGSGRKLAKDLTLEWLDQHVRQSASLGMGSEVAWALWGTMIFKLPLSEEAGRSLCGSKDNVVALLALDAHRRGLIPSGLDSSAWAQLMRPESLDSPDWLLAYEANIKGWLPNVAGDFVAGDPCYGYLKSRGVAFYDQARVSLKAPVVAYTRSTTSPKYSL